MKNGEIIVKRVVPIICFLALLCSIVPCSAAAAEASAADVYTWLAEHNVPKFSIPEKAHSFMEENPQFFPAGDDDFEDMLAHVDFELDFPHIAKSPSKYGDRLMTVSGKITDCQEVETIYGTITVLQIVDDSRDRHLMYYLGTLEDAFKDCYAQAVVLPFGTITAVNMGGSYTQAVIGAACYVAVADFPIETDLEAIYNRIQASDLTAFAGPDEWYKVYEVQAGYYLDTSSGRVILISYTDRKFISVSDEGGFWVNRYNGEYTQEQDGKYVYSSLDSPGDEYTELRYDQTDGSLTTLGGVYYPMMGHGEQYTIPANFDKNWYRADEIYSRSYTGPYDTMTVSGPLDDWIDVTSDVYGFCSFGINDYEGAACGGVYYINDEGKELYYYPDLRLILFVDSSGGCLVGRDNSY